MSNFIDLLNALESTDDEDLQDALEWLVETDLKLVDEEPQRASTPQGWTSGAPGLEVALQLECDDEGRTHVALSGDPARAAKLFWRIALSERGRVHRQEDGSAVIAPGLVAVFADGTWDTLSGYTPREDESDFWTQVGACYAQLPSWLLL